MLSRFTQIASSSGSSYNYKSAYNKDKLKALGKTSCEQDYLLLKKKLKEAEKKVSASCAGIVSHSRKDSSKKDVSINQEQAESKTLSEQSLDNESNPSRSIAMRDSTYTKCILTEIKEVNLDEENIRESPRQGMNSGLLNEARDQRKRVKDQGKSVDRGKAEKVKEKLGKLLEDRTKEAAQKGYMSIDREAGSRKSRQQRHASREPDSGSPAAASNRSEEIMEKRTRSPKIMFVNSKRDTNLRRNSMEDKAGDSELDPFCNKNSLSTEQNQVLASEIRMKLTQTCAAEEVTPEQEIPKRKTPTKPKIIKFASAGIKEKKRLLQESISQVLQADSDLHNQPITDAAEQISQPRMSIRIRLKERDKSESLTLKSKASSSNRKESKAQNNRHSPMVPLKLPPKSKSQNKNKRKNHSTHKIKNQVSKDVEINRRSLSRASKNIPSQDRLSRASIDRSESVIGQSDPPPLPIVSIKPKDKTVTSMNKKPNDVSIKRITEDSPQPSSKTETSKLSKPNNRHLISSLLFAKGRNPEDEENEMRQIKEEIKSRRLALEKEEERNHNPIQPVESCQDVKHELIKEQSDMMPIKKTKNSGKGSDSIQIKKDLGFKSNGPSKQTQKLNTSTNQARAASKTPDITKKSKIPQKLNNQPPVQTAKIEKINRKPENFKANADPKKEVPKDRNQARKQNSSKTVAVADTSKPQTLRKLSPKVKKAAKEYLDMVGKLNEKETTTGSPASPKELLQKTEEIMKDIDESEPRHLETIPKLVPVPEDVVKEEEEDSMLLGEKKNEEKTREIPIDQVFEHIAEKTKPNLSGSGNSSTNKDHIKTQNNRGAKEAARKPAYERLYEFGNIGAPPSFRQLKEKLG